MAESYVPLLEALTDLLESGIRARITLGVTPVLAEQLADPLIASNFEAYLEQEIEAAHDDVQRFGASTEGHFLYLAHYYLDWYTHVLDAFRNRFNRDIIGALRGLQDAGAIEIITSAATHPYLPLMRRDSTIDAQLEIGKRSSMRHFGKEPRAIWLPECAYRPGYYETASDGTRYERLGLEYWLQTRGLGLFFSESNAVEGSKLLGHPEFTTREILTERPRTVQVASAGSDIYGQVAQMVEEMEYESAGFVTERKVVPFETEGQAWEQGGTFQAYYVRESEVAVIGRNRAVGEQVWAAKFGYPGDGEYREFHKKDAVHGFQYWRVTDSKADLAYKQPYDPYKAGQRVEAHADHFISLLEEQFRWYNVKSGGAPGIIASAYDTELFGHWWFEGVQFLKEVLTRLAQHERIDMVTASEWLDQHPPERVIDLPESSWGHAGTHITWINPETSWMWDLVHAAELRMEELVERFGSAGGDGNGDVEAALNQAARELVLLEASDWEFLYTTGQARQYATDRFTEHVDRFNALADAAEASPEQAASLARDYGERDNLFPDIDYRLFARKQPI
jgi:1,4-alpha-glucan branching enzyme